MFKESFAPSGEELNFEDRQRLIENHQSLVQNIAGKIHRGLPLGSGVDLEDLVSEGQIGLIQAVDKYDPRKGIPFGAFASSRIQGAMTDYLRRSDHLSRDLRSQVKQLVKAQGELSQKLGRAVSLHESALELGLNGSQLKKLLNILMHKEGPLSLSQPVNTKRGKNQIDVAQKGSKNPDEIAEFNELQSILTSEMGKLRPQERQIIKSRYQDGLSQEEVGEQLDLSPSRVSQLEKGALNKLARTLRRKGVTSASNFLS